MSELKWIQNIVPRYRPWPRLYYYAGPKMRWDPAYPAVVRSLSGSSAPVLDIGCGAGLLAAYLRESGLKSPILGLEPCQEKIEIANKAIASAYPDTVFTTGDARELPPHHGHVVMLDVLHYFSDAEQKAVLQAVCDRVAPGCYALIRFTAKDWSWRYIFTQIEELIVRGSGWIVGGKWNFPTRECVVDPFNEAGFVSTITPMWGRTPFNSYLGVFQRRPEK